MAEVRRTLAAAIPLLVVALAAAWAWAGDSSVWQKAAWRFHPPEGYPTTEKFEHEKIMLLANGQVALVGRLASNGEGFVQLHDEEGRWLWTALLPGKDLGLWSDQTAAAVRSSSGAWDLVVSDDGSHIVWRLDDQGKLLWGRRLREDVGLAWSRAVATENGDVWLGGWTATGDFDCGDGAGVVKLDQQGNVVWRWREPPESFGAASDLVPLGDGRLLVLLVNDAGCTPTVESELVLLDADGEEIKRHGLPFEYLSREMIRLADGRIALLVPRQDRSEVNRLFIVSIDEQTSALSIAETELDESFATGDDFYLLPAAAGRDGGILFFVGYALQWISSTGEVTRTERVPPEDWRPCWVQPSKVLCVDAYLLRWIQIP